MWIALIPAHNEEAGIVKTVKGILAQTVPPSRVVVMADNCTDNTVEYALQAGAEVIETVENKAKKAGALNQGLSRFLPELSDSDYVLLQDADGELAPDFVEQALVTYAQRSTLGGLSGAIHARTPENMVEAAQAIEYARGTRLMSRKQGKVHVLSGAATLFPVSTLRDVQKSRGTRLPGALGTVFMEDSLTEDYELTIAIRKLGYDCRSTKRCKVVTDLMPTWRDLQTQRVRWYRGALETLWMYGWSKLTHKIWMGVAYTLLLSLLLPLSIIMVTVAYFLWGVTPDFRYMLIFPLFVLEHYISAKRVNDWRATLLSVTFFPLWVYDNFMLVTYWRALFQAIKGKSRVWIT